MDSQSQPQSQELPITTPLHTPDFTQPKMEMPELQSFDAEHMGGLTIYHNIWQDPTLPMEQDPQIEQDIWLQERPGELAKNAPATLQRGADYQQQSEPYPRSWLATGKGDSWRGRHMSLLDDGLEPGPGAR